MKMGLNLLIGTLAIAAAVGCGSSEPAGDGKPVTTDSSGVRGSVQPTGTGASTVQATE
jgi:ABC-type phosphate transport system substrate-binding protein